MNGRSRGFQGILLGGLMLTLPWCAGCSANMQHVLFQSAFAGARIITDTWLTILANALLDRM